MNQEKNPAELFLEQVLRKSQEAAASQVEDQIKELVRQDFSEKVKQLLEGGMINRESLRGFEEYLDAKTLSKAAPVTSMPVSSPKKRVSIAPNIPPTPTPASSSACGGGRSWGVSRSSGC